MLLLLLLFILPIIFHKVFIYNYYKKNIGNIYISNLRGVNKSEFYIETLRYLNNFTLLNNTIKIEKNKIQIHSAHTIVNSIENINFNEFIYKFSPLLLNLRPSKKYSLEITIKELQFLKNILINVSLMLSINVSFKQIRTKFIKLDGKLIDIEPDSQLIRYFNLQNFKELFPYFIPINFSIESKYDFLTANLINDYLKISIKNKNTFFDIMATIFEHDTVLCKVKYKNTIKFITCFVNINKLKLNKIHIKNFTSYLSLNFLSKKFNFTLFDIHFNISYNNINVSQHNRDCKIEGHFNTKNIRIKSYFMRKCNFFVNNIKLSLRNIKIYYHNNKYTTSIYADNISIENNNFSLKLKNTKTTLDIFAYLNPIEINFKVSSNSMNIFSTYLNSLPMTYRNLFTSGIPLKLKGESKVNLGTNRVEFSKLSGRIGNITIFDSAIVLTNNQELLFLELGIDHLLLLDNNIVPTTILDEFRCNLKVKKIRKILHNIEILGDFEKCSLFISEFLQAHEIGGFWRISLDTEFKNPELSITTNSGIVAIKTKQYSLSGNHIIILNIPIKRTANILELNLNISFIPQNEYINSTLFIFIQKHNNTLLFDGQGKLVSNLKSNNFLSKFSFKINFDTISKSFNIEYLKNIFLINIKNLYKFKQVFEEFFDFVKLQGYFSVKGNFVIKNSKLDSLTSTVLFLSPELTFDNISMHNIKMKIPIHINDKMMINKSYIKFLLTSPVKAQFFLNIDKVVPPCIYVRKIRLKNTYFYVSSKKFNACIITHTQAVNNLHIPIDRVNFDTSNVKIMQNIIKTVASNKGKCEIEVDKLKFSCIISLNIVSDYFTEENTKFYLTGHFLQAQDIKYVFNADFRDLNIEEILKKIGFPKSLTGLYNVNFRKLKVKNGRIKEVDGYIKSMDETKKRIFVEFFVTLIKNLFNVKFDQIKKVKKFHHLGFYFRYIKEKLLIKGLYYKKGRRLFPYDIKDFSQREILLKSKGIKDCLIYGHGSNVLNFCSKGGLIISINKLLKLKNILSEKIKMK